MTGTKKRIESKTVIANMMLPSQANPAGNVHGGEIMKMMDNCAGATAMRHSASNVVTARVDSLIFMNPIYVGNLVTCTGEVVFTGRTSMEIKVTVFSNDMTCENKDKICQTAFFTFVALDDNGKPKAIPQLETFSEMEKIEFIAGEKRYLEYKNHKH